MTGFRYPNESDAYRAERDELLTLESDLRAQVEAVAQKRRELPLGGRLAEDYRFEKMGDDGKVREIPFADLFGSHRTLLLYSYMFGADWDAPCPSCTSLIDGYDAHAHSITQTAALAVVAQAGPQKLCDWAKQRGWTGINLVSGQKTDYLLRYAGYENATDPTAVSIMNVFVKKPDGIFHTWGSELVGHPMDNGHPRHLDLTWTLWNVLDLTPEGRGDAPVPVQDYTHADFTEKFLGG